jgi:hypothetical protein
MVAAQYFGPEISHLAILPDDLPSIVSRPKLPPEIVNKAEAAMYELAGALAFALVVVGYVLAIIFVQHEDDGYRERAAPRHEKIKQ